MLLSLIEDDSEQESDERNFIDNSYSEDEQSKERDVDKEPDLLNDC